MCFIIFISQRGQSTDTVKPKWKIWCAFNIVDDYDFILFEGMRKYQ